jgi:hypothetical protein
MNSVAQDFDMEQPDSLELSYLKGLLNWKKGQSQKKENNDMDIDFRREVSASLSL